MSVQRVLVVGGNGLLGSAICKTAVAKGWDVSSMSSSGRPYVTPAGHTPKWVHSVRWQKASAFDLPTFTPLIDSDTAVVHTLGILLEDAKYKESIRDGDVLGLIRAFTGGSESDNPLKTREEKRSGYEGVNRDSALNVLDAMLSVPSSSRRPFVYISAADAFRPLVPQRYIETKREAENEILRRTMDKPEAGIRPVFIRPGLMYHPHIRPISTLPAFMLSLSASLPLPNPFSRASFVGGGLQSLKTHPLHVDHVAEAVIRSIAEPECTGIIDVETMRTWAGLRGPGAGRAAEETVPP